MIETCGFFSQYKTNLMRDKERGVHI